MVRPGLDRAAGFLISKSQHRDVNLFRCKYAASGTVRSRENRASL